MDVQRAFLTARKMFIFEETRLVFILTNKGQLVQKRKAPKFIRGQAYKGDSDSPKSWR